MKRIGLATLAVVLPLAASLLRAGDDRATVELRGEGIIVQIQQKEGEVVGSIERDGQKFPFRATAGEDQTITGKFTADGEAFPFKISIVDAEKGTMVLETEGTRYHLSAAPVGKRPPAPAPLKAGKEKSHVHSIVLERRTLHDSATQLEVATLLVPQGWKLDEKMLWKIDRGQFVTLTSRVSDPSGQVAMQWLPIEQFSADPTLAANARRQGGPPLSGGMELVDRFPNAEQYIKTIAIPRHVKVPEPRVVNAEALPRIARTMMDANAAMIAAGRGANREFRFDAARVRIEYATEDGAAMEADIYCGLLITWDVRMNATRQQTGLPPAYLFWPQQLYSFSAPKGELDARTPLLQTIVGSMRPTLQWDAFLSNIQAMRQRAVLNDQAIGKAIQAEITESQKQTWEANMKSQDKIADGFGDVLRGVNRYVDPADPDGNHVLLPAGFKQAWSDGQKRYIVSDDGNFNPNQDPNLNGNWQEMKPPQ